jgi:hypothetical protein
MKRSWGVIHLEAVVLLMIALMAANAADSSAVFIGGTVSQFRPGQDGKLMLSNSDSITFRSKEQKLEIPVNKISTVEYGQKADRRYLTALLVSPLFLLAKKRDHFLTLHFKDDKGYDQALVLRIPKGAVRATLASLEARTGLKVRIQDDEARKAYRS